MYIRIVGLFSAKLSAYRHKGEQVVLFVCCLVCNEVLVLFADLVPLAVILKDVAAKSRLAVVYCYSCRCNCVCSLDVSVSMIDCYDLYVVDFNHYFVLSA